MQQGAKLTRIEGANTAAALKAKGRSAVTGSILSAAGTVAGKWYSPKSAAVTQTAKAPADTNFHSTSYQRSLRVA